MLQPLKPGMTEPVITRCPDGHFRRVIFGLATYIADYPEQALLSCTVQGWCAKFVNIIKNSANTNSELDAQHDRMISTATPMRCYVVVSIQTHSSKTWSWARYGMNTASLVMSWYVSHSSFILISDLYI